MRPTALRRSTRRQPKGISPAGWAVHGQIPAAPSTQPILELDSLQTVVPLLLRPHVTVEEATVEEPDIECQLISMPSPARGYDGEDKTKPHRIHRQIAWLTWLLFVVYVTYAAMLNMQIFLLGRPDRGV